ncbi:hypothetical protein Pint_01154 [Pistacia integerrima]|uniref:Uncharacterized protein n=1 Tax=Pistacia integerrima TaxID=434235 RepID=A0ACC0ZI23_9ROSI|nr:hypothetical protein Pint_01154 [Pistacia integerrima]
MEHKVELTEIEAQAEQLAIEFNDDDDDISNDDESMLPGEEEDDLGNLIIVDNLPLVVPEKFGKLSSAVRKIFGRFGVMKEDMFKDIFFMPVDSNTGQTLGYCFIEYDTPQEAELAKQSGNGLIMGKDGRYKFSVTLFNEFDRIMNVADEWTPPEKEQYAN